MPTDPKSEPAITEALNSSFDRSFVENPGWWMQVLRVRLRFVFILVSVGVVVSQWPLVRSVWDRWMWTSSGPQSSGSVSGSHEYFCPMDPGVISDWPAICPICNMDLVTRKKTDAVILPEGVLARMQLSPYRIQLAGIRTSVVQPRELTYEQTYSGILQRSHDGSVGFEANVFASGGTTIPTGSATVQTSTSAQRATATVSLVEGAVPPRFRIVLDESNAIAAGSIVLANVASKLDAQDEMLAVPESAVVDRGRERLVYVETMPGMFDGVAVELGRRCGGFYPVTKGLKSGQRVASAGAFLIDAETRLNPSLAAGYFGASQGAPNRNSPPPPVNVTPPASPSTRPAASKTKLSREDQALADQQRICPVTELPLNSMGGPVPVTVAGRKVFICCGGCEKRLKDEPEKYLARISSK